MKSVQAADATFQYRLLARRTQVSLTVLLAYGGGLWLNVLHEAEGAAEPGAPPAALHWLRDASLGLPLVALGVFLGAELARRLLARYGASASDGLAAAVVVTVSALYASVVLAIGNPIHGLAFAATHGAQQLPLGVHLMRDGLLALSANVPLAAGLAAFLHRR
jgi:hypothetical protein